MNRQHRNFYVKLGSCFLLKKLDGKSRSKSTTLTFSKRARPTQTPTTAS